jgi:hypothetical protein
MRKSEKIKDKYVDPTEIVHRVMDALVEAETECSILHEKLSIYESAMKDILKCKDLNTEGLRQIARWAIKKARE